METLLILCLVISGGVLAGVAWKFLSPRADGFVITMVSFFAVMMGLLVVALAATIKQEGRIDKAKRLARESCAPGKARVFHDEGKQAVVFSCKSDSILRVIRYKHDPKPPKRIAERQPSVP